MGVNVVCGRYRDMVWRVFVPVQFGGSVDGLLVLIFQLMCHLLPEDRDHQCLHQHQHEENQEHRAPTQDDNDQDTCTIFPREMWTVFDEAARYAAQQPSIIQPLTIQPLHLAPPPAPPPAAAGVCADNGEGGGGALLLALHGLCHSDARKDGQGSGLNVGLGIDLLPVEALVPASMELEQVLRLLQDLTCSRHTYHTAFVSKLAWALALAHSRQIQHMQPSRHPASPPPRPADTRARAGCNGGTATRADTDTVTDMYTDRDKRLAGMTARQVFDNWLTLPVSVPWVLDASAGHAREKQPHSQPRCVMGVLKKAIADGLLQRMASASATQEARLLQQWLAAAAAATSGTVAEAAAHAHAAPTLHQLSPVPLSLHTTTCPAAGGKVGRARTPTAKSSLVPPQPPPTLATPAMPAAAAEEAERNMMDGAEEANRGGAALGAGGTHGLHARPEPLAPLAHVSGMDTKDDAHKSKNLPPQHMSQACTLNDECQKTQDTDARQPHAQRTFAQETDAKEMVQEDDVWQDAKDQEDARHWHLKTLSGTLTKHTLAPTLQTAEEEEEDEDEDEVVMLM